MEKATRICKICGVEYPYCKTNRPTGIFRWQDVACCPEHGAEYFEKIARARGEATEESSVVASQNETKPKGESRKKKGRAASIGEVEV